MVNDSTLERVSSVTSITQQDIAHAHTYVHAVNIEEKHPSSAEKRLITASKQGEDKSGSTSVVSSQQCSFECTVHLSSIQCFLFILCYSLFSLKFLSCFTKYI